MRNERFLETGKIIQGLAHTTPSSSVPRYVSLKNYQRLTIVIEGSNTSSVTGSAITLKQAQAIANTGEKALAFDKSWVNLNTTATDTLVETAVTASTFTTDNTNSLKYQYVIEVDPSTLDVTNGYDCVRLGTGDATNTAFHVTYLLWPTRIGRATPPSAIQD